MSWAAQSHFWGAVQTLPVFPGSWDTRPAQISLKDSREPPAGGHRSSCKTINRQHLEAKMCVYVCPCITARTGERQTHYNPPQGAQQSTNASRPILQGAVKKNQIPSHSCRFSLKFAGKKCGGPGHQLPDLVSPSVLDAFFRQHVLLWRAVHVRKNTSESRGIQCR